MAFGMKKSVASVFSVLLLSGSIMADDNQPTKPMGHDSALFSSPGKYIKENPAVAVALLALLLAELRFQTKDTDRLPCRYDFNKFKTGDANWNDVWNVIDDGIVGQQFKPDSVKVGDDGKLVVTALKPVKGVLGYVHTYSNAVINAVAVTGFVYLLQDFIVRKEQSSLYKLMASKNSEIFAAIVAGFVGSKIVASRTGDAAKTGSVA